MVIFSVGYVAQSATSFAVDLSFRVVQQLHQHRHSIQLSHLLLDAVVLITQVLQVGGSIGLDWVHRVAEHRDHLMQVGVSPARVSADAVQADHAVAFVGELQCLCPTHGLEERIQVPLQLGHEGVIVATSADTERVMQAYWDQDQEVCLFSVSLRGNKIESTAA